jgi:hypothetical protein
VTVIDGSNGWRDAVNRARTRLLRIMEADSGVDALVLELSAVQADEA